MHGRASDQARGDAALFERMHDPLDPLDRAAVIELHLPLARSVAGWYAFGPEAFDDTFQVACVGLVKAVDRFSIDREIAFSSYAVPTMAGEIKRYYRDRTWTIRPPRALQELALHVSRAGDELAAVLGREATVGELAQRLDVAEEDVLEALYARSARRAMSLDAPASSDDPNGSVTFGELIGREDVELARVDDMAGLDGLISVLPKRTRAIVRERFFGELTQREIGELHGLSQMQISRILRAALERLRVLSDAT